jgi:hypothetical protein
LVVLVVLVVDCHLLLRVYRWVHNQAKTETSQPEEKRGRTFVLIQRKARLILALMVVVAWLFLVIIANQIVGVETPLKYLGMIPRIFAYRSFFFKYLLHLIK